MSADAVALSIDALRPHVAAVAAIGARLIPVAFMCPLFGGSHAPTHVKLGVVLSVAVFLHQAGGVGAALQVATPFELLGLAVQELAYGLSLGLIASLPFDAARMGGRFIDLFRGSSAEAALPLAGTKESASGDALYHLLLALGSAGALMPLLMRALTKSYALAPLGWFRPTDAWAEQMAALVGNTFSSAFALGAPIAALALTVDLGLGLASRAAPSMNLQETGTPLRILAGGAVLWLSIGLVAAHLQDFALANVEAMMAR
jgi:type III secretion protein T